MALNFPDSPSQGQTYTSNGVTYVYNANKDYWLTQSILPPASDFDLNTLTTSTSDADGDYFAVIDTSGAQKKLTKGNINISGFNNNSGYVTASSDTTFTNKGGNISQWTNDVGYVETDTDTTYTLTPYYNGAASSIRLTAGGSGSGSDDVYIVGSGGTTVTSNSTHIVVSSTGGTESDTLATVVSRGSSTTSAISVGSVTASNTSATSIFQGPMTANNTVNFNNWATFNWNVMFQQQVTANTNVQFKGEVIDAGGSSGVSGQILSSTGSGVDWIDAPTGGGGGITTGKAIAMAMVFG